MCLGVERAYMVIVYRGKVVIGGNWVTFTESHIELPHSNSNIVDPHIV